MSENDTQDETATFDYFGREWHVPTKRHHRHIRETKRILREEGGVDVDDIAAIYLSPEEYEALSALDVSVDDLQGFATRITETLGLGSTGNSEPSPASS